MKTKFKYGDRIRIFNLGWIEAEYKDGPYETHRVYCGKDNYGEPIWYNNYFLEGAEYSDMKKPIGYGNHLPLTPTQ